LLLGKNGSGKTSVAELLSYCLYEKTSKGEWKDGVINRSQGKSLLITLDLEREEQPGKWVKYRVIHARKHPKHPTGVRIWKEGQRDPITPVKKPAQAQKMCAELIGMSYEEFRAAVSLGHETVHPLVIGTDGSRIEYITKTFDLDHYDALAEKTSSELETTQEMLSRKGECEARISLYSQKMQSLPSRMDSRTQIQRLKEEIGEKEEEKDTLSLKITRYIRRMDAQKRRDKAEHALETSGSTKSEDPPKLRKQIDSLSQRIQNLDSVISAWSRVTPLIKERDRLLSAQKEKPPHFDEDEYKKTQQKLSDLRSRVHKHSTLAGKGKCPTCGQKLDGISISRDEYSGMVKREKRLKKTLRLLEEKRKRVLLHARTAERAEELSIRIRKETPEKEASGLKEERGKYQTQLGRARAAYERSVRLQNMKAEIAELPPGDWKKTRRSLLRLQEKANSISHFISKKSAALALVSKDAQTRKEAQREITQASTELKAFTEHEYREKLLKSLLVAFGKNGLKHMRVRLILDTLVQRLHHHTRTLLPRYEFKLNEDEKKISFTVVDIQSQTSGDVRSLSNGEKKRLSIALLLTERDLRLVRTNVLFLDEFDGGLDSEGREDLLEILIGLKDQYGSIFAITHSSDILLHSGFDARYRVEREGDESLMTRLRR
jgi:DNA repair exonuclease SbcCD ATPase subunit